MEKEITQVTVCGGGNAAHTLVGLMGNRPDVRVNVYTPLIEEAEALQQAMKNQSGIEVYFTDKIVCGRPQRISARPIEVVPGSDLVLLALPAFAHERVLQEIAPFFDEGTWVGALPARGGFDWCAAEKLGNTLETMTLFGLQTLPWACRVEHFGESVRVMGSKDFVEIATRPPERASEVALTLGELLGMRLRPVECFLCLTLANVGQILHPGLMYGLFHKWDGEPYSQAPLFYQGVDAEAAEVLQQLSGEILELRNTLEKVYPCLDFSLVRPLDEWLRLSYARDIGDDSSIEASLKTNRSYAGLTAPMCRVDGGLVPDFKSRYLIEDVPFGLVVTRGMAELAGVKTPQMDRIIYWSQEHMRREYLKEGKLKGRDICSTRAPQRYGIGSVDRLDGCN